MGTFAVQLRVSDLAGRNFVDVEATVDTGATYTLLPADMLEQLQIEPEGTRRLEVADDRIVEYPIGYARVQAEGEQSIALVVFGPEGVSPLLGATSLELLSFAVDPVHRRLVPVDGLLKSATG